MNDFLSSTHAPNPVPSERGATGGAGSPARRWQALVAAGVALVASLTVFGDLVIRGPMAWHFKHSAAIQGGLEAIMLAAVLAWAARKASRAALAIAGVVVLLFLRRHHVDLPFAFTLLSAEMLLSMGALMLGPAIADVDRSANGIRRLVTGLVLWLSAMLLLHTSHKGYPGTLLAVFVVMGAVAMLFNRRSELLVPTFRAFVAQSPRVRMLWSLVLSWLLVLMARTNVVFGFDTMWYPARGSMVLAPSGSFFDQLGLVSAVHYFPKLWELLILPLEWFGDLSFQGGQALMLGALGLVATARLFGRLGVPDTFKPLCVLAVATLPAVASTAILLKTDIAAWAFLLVAADAFASWLKTRDWNDFAWGVIGIALACSSKLTVVPYAGLLALAAIIIAIIKSRTWRGTPISTRTAVVVLLAILVGATLLFRTWLLTGIPTIGPDPLVSLWNMLGLHLRPPAGTLNWLYPQNWSDAPKLLPEALFAPNGLPKLRISWTGNVWLLAALFAIAWKTAATPQADRDLRPLRITLWLFAIAGLALLLVWAYHTRGSDGNYFIVPVTAACLLSFSAMLRASRDRSRRIGAAWLLLICSGWQAALGFVSAGWAAPGTSRLDLHFARSPIDTPHLIAGKLNEVGLGPIHNELRSLPAWTRTVVVGPSELAHFLPTRLESFEHIFYSRPEFADPASFAGYLRSACIERLVLDLESREWQLAVVEQALSAVSHQALIDGPRWRLLEIDICRLRMGRGFNEQASESGEMR